MRVATCIFLSVLPEEGTMTPPLFICFFNQLFTGIVGCGLTSRGNGADFGILRMDFIKSCFVKISAKTALAA
ncbi:hypothetical protein KP13_32020 [Klebsiella pneumoniae subsp. pneumoniae Kp13]|nr:hypothetical protein KP13_32020 [Klebsiella pneumoniae subsp. pneumoniae Kp13]